MDIGTKGYLTFKDGSTAKVIIVDIRTYPASGMPSDYFLSYQDGETNRPITHDQFEDRFLLPEMLMREIFTPESQQPMEEKEESNQDPVNRLLNSMGIDMDNPVETAELPSAYDNCTMVYKSAHKKKGLPIYIGVDKKKSLFYVGFGADANPLCINKEEAIYMITALGALISQGLKDQFGKELSDIEKEVEHISKDIVFSAGKSSGKTSASDLKQQIESEDAPDDAEVTKIMEEIKGNVEEIESMAEQVEEYTKNMTPEEKKEYVNKLTKKREELLAKKAREFERSLLGTIEEEESITYNYDYFQQIHHKHGPEALKEELAKIPNKEERQEIIQKIIAEAKLKKQQQKPSNNNEENH